MVIALSSRQRRAFRATDIRVLKRTLVGPFCEEGAVEPGLQDRSDRGNGAGPDGEPMPAGGIEAHGLVGPGQGEDTETGAEALFRMGSVGHHRFAERRD